MINLILNSNQIHWLQLVKIGIIFLLIGMLILIFKELIIVLIASVFIVIGIFMFYLAFSIWNRTKNY